MLQYSFHFWFSLYLYLGKYNKISRHKACCVKHSMLNCRSTNIFLCFEYVGPFIFFIFVPVNSENCHLRRNNRVSSGSI